MSQLPEEMKKQIERDAEAYSYEHYRLLDGTPARDLMAMRAYAAGASKYAEMLAVAELALEHYCGIERGDDSIAHTSLERLRKMREGKE